MDKRARKTISLFIHSFIPAISIAPLQVLYYSEALPTTARIPDGYCIGVSRRSAQATAGKELTQGPYKAARAGVEPSTLRLKAIDSTKAPPCSLLYLHFMFSNPPKHQRQLTLQNCTFSSFNPLTAEI